MRYALVCSVLAALGAASAVEARAGETVVDVARRDGRLRTLVAAVEAAGLGADLAGPGPFTVFAPLDAAFEALPAGALDRLLADRDALRRVLLHHVARGARPAAEVVQYDAVRTLADTTLPIRAGGGGVQIGEGKVVVADVKASNGVIHVIDRVLLPPAAAPARPDLPLLRVAEAAGGFRTLVAAVRAAGLEDALAGAGPFTVFAPSDEAFAVLPPGALEALLKDRDRLARLLRHHVVSGELTAAAAAGRAAVTTLAGTTLRLDARDGLAVAGAVVVRADVLASNGVIHVVDRLLVPPPADARQGRGPARAGSSCAVSDYLPQGGPARRTFRKTVRNGLRTERTELTRTEGEHESGGVRVADSEGEYQDYEATEGGPGMRGQSMRAQGFVQRYLPPLRLFPAAAEPGVESTFESVVEHETRGRVTRGRVTRRVVFEGVEAVTTPAGTFDDCLRFSVHQVNRPDDARSFVAETRETVWLARGKGEVKSAGVTELRTNQVPWLRAEVELVLARDGGDASGRDGAPRD